MRWKTHGERQIYTNDWVNLCLVDVQQPDGRRWCERQCFYRVQTRSYLEANPLRALSDQDVAELWPVGSLSVQVVRPLMASPRYFTPRTRKRTVMMAVLWRAIHAFQSPRTFADFAPPPR